jgi:hypothetical protein
MVAVVYPEQQRVALVTCRDCVQFVDAPGGAVTVPVVELVQAMALAQECTRQDWATQIETAAASLREQLAALEKQTKPPVSVQQAALRHLRKKVLKRRLKRLEAMLNTLLELDARFK